MNDLWFDFLYVVNLEVPFKVTLNSQAKTLGLRNIMSRAHHQWLNSKTEEEFHQSKPGGLDGFDLE